MVFIPIEEIQPGMVLAEDVYVFYSMHVSLLKKGQALTKRFVDRLRMFGIPGIYTRGDEEADLLPENPLISRALKAQAVTSVQAAFDLAAHPERSDGKEILHLNDIVLSLIDNILDDQTVLVNIEDLKSYDDYTYHHSLSVCLLSISAGTAMGMNRDQLHKLGLCAILHDIGKMRIPIEIINKPDRLTDTEFETVKRHAQFGGNYLLERRFGDEGIYRSVVSHHERVDGTGYPRGLGGRDIPLEARIISVADVYDALTSNRPYRAPLPYAEAVEYLMGGCDTLFDMDVVKAFLKRLEIYPVGSFVELSTGHKGVVINNENLLRPVVRLVEGGGEIFDLYRDARLRSVVITRAYQGRAMKDPSDLSEK